MSRMAFTGGCVGVYALWQIACVFLFSLGAGAEGLCARLIVYSVAYGVFFLLAWVGTKVLPGDFTLKKFVCPSRRFSFRLLFSCLVAWFSGCALTDFILFGRDIVRNAGISAFLSALPLVIVFTALQCLNEEFIYRMFPVQLLYGGLPEKRPERLVLCSFSGIFFLCPHITNLEARATGYALSVLLFYFLMGFLLMYVSCITSGYEAAIGIHIGNNLFCNLLVEPSVTSFPMAALFRNTRSIGGSPLYTLLETAVPFAVVLLVLRLLFKVHFPLKQL